MAKQQRLCLSLDDAIATLPEFLQPSDEQERNELAMFLSQVDELHKPVASKLNASSVFNFLDRMLNPPTPITKGPLEVTFPEQLQEITENIAAEIASCVISDVDLHNTTISVFKVLQEVSWEAKTALTLATFVLTFGDKGLNLCEEFKVSVNEIQMFAKLQGGFKHQLEGCKNPFTIVFKLIGSIVPFENLSTKYMISEDPNVKIKRTLLVVIAYWIIRFIVAAATSHVLQLSSGGNEAHKTSSTLWDKWSKTMEDLDDKNYLVDMLIRLQDLLREDLDIEAYKNIKKIVEQENHIDNLIVLNALFSSSSEDTTILYDCLQKQKVDLSKLKEERVLLFISELENIAPEVDNNKLNEFINSFDAKSESEVDCKIVWMPIVDVDRTPVRTKSIETSMMLKPFLEWYYLVHYTKLLKDVDGERYFKGLYSVGDPSRISNEVKKLIKDDWKYKKGEPMIVVLDPLGKVVHQNAIHMFYSWGLKAFPFTSKKEKNLSYELDESGTYDSLWSLLTHGWDNIYNDWGNNYDAIFLYGGEGMEWIRSFSVMLHDVAREAQVGIRMVYIGRCHNQELIQSVKDENLSHCLSDKFHLWMFWQRINSIIYSLTHTGYVRCGEILTLQRLLNYDKSNVGWTFNYQDSNNAWGTLHGKVVLLVLKQFQLWKDKASQGGFFDGFVDHYVELYKKILPLERFEFPNTALNQAPSIDLETMECVFCENQMEQYTSFVCYHPPSSEGYKF